MGKHVAGNIRNILWSSNHPILLDIVCNLYSPSLAAKAHFQFHGAPASQVLCPVFQPSSCCQIRRSEPAWVSSRCPACYSPSCCYCWLNVASGLERRCRHLKMTDQHTSYDTVEPVFLMDPDSPTFRPSGLVFFILKPRDSIWKMHSSNLIQALNLASLPTHLLVLLV